MTEKLRARILAAFAAPQAADGLTPVQVCTAIGRSGHGSTHIRFVMVSMPELYVDRWLRNKRGPCTPVFCTWAGHFKERPEHCPRPERLHEVA
jgi:hypothetical protein